MEASSRYILFAFEQTTNDRKGGAGDFIGIFSSIKEAKEHFYDNYRPHEWVGQIANDSMEIITYYDRFAVVPVPVHYKPEHWEYRWSDE